MKTITKLILIACCGLSLTEMNAQSVTFNYTGALQTWTVPCGVTSVTIEAKGAQGGSGTQYFSYAGGTGGLGADVKATYTVVPSSTLNVYVGGQLLFNGGGSAQTFGGAGNGGDASDVRVGGLALSNRIIVAGGGGGGGAEGNGSYTNNNGGNGGAGGLYGYVGQPGTSQGGGSYTAGLNGTSLSGGNGGLGYYDGGAGGGGGGAGGGGAGNSCSYCADVAGNGGTGGACGQNESNYGANGGCLGVGGSSTTSSSNGGGGGGGYYGGGGGSAGNGNQWAGGGGGGGGSSYIGSGSNSTVTDGVISGNGSVTITWATSTIVVSGNVINNVSCNGGSNGKASGIISSGAAPFTYAWTPSGGTKDTAIGLSAGSYTLTVTDPCGTATAVVTITQPLVLAATATTTTNITCNGGSTGATASTVTGGSTPYTYSWTGGSTNATATGLTARSYTLSVTDKNGCSATASTVVTQPNALSDSSYTIKNVLCHGGSTGSAGTIASGGTMPYTYLWTPGGATKDTASGLSAGTYTLMISDACGASATASVSVTQPTAIGITSTSSDDNGSGNGAATVAVTGGSSPYTYLWTPSGKTTATITGETFGQYCCKITDANGCKDSLCVTINKGTGIDGITGNSAQIVVYPNPNNGQFNIESSIDGASSVEIYNILGEKVYTKNLSTTKGVNTINVNNQPNGVYLYRIISDNGNLLGEGRISIQK